MFGCESDAERTTWVNAVQKEILSGDGFAFKEDAWASLPEIDGLILRHHSRPVLMRVLVPDGKPIVEEARVLDAERGDNVPLCAEVRRVSGMLKGSNVTVHAIGRCLSGGHQTGVGGTTRQALDPSGSAVWDGGWIMMKHLAQHHANTMLLFSVHLSGATVALLPDDEQVAHGLLALCDEAGRIRFGAHSISLWPGAGSRFAWNTDSPSNAEDVCGNLSIWLGPPEIPKSMPVVYSSNPTHELDEPLELFSWGVGVSFLEAVKEEAPGAKQRLERRTNIYSTSETRNPLDTPSKNDRVLYWETRDPCNVDSIVRALSVCDWTSPKQREEAKLFCAKVDAIGTRLPRYLAFNLLSHLYPLECVRGFAMRHVLGWADCVFGEVAMPIFGLLSFSTHGYSSQAVMLLRYLQETEHRDTARSFFWAMHSLSQQSTGLRSRFKLYLEVFVAMSRDKCEIESFQADAALVNILNECARDELRRTMSLSSLVMGKHPEALREGPLQLPLHFGNPVGRLNLKRSKALPSNAAPLLLRFDPPPGSTTVPPSYIWKSGDDLATDQLILRYGQAFNKIWDNDGVNAHLHLYGCAPTGDRVGLIEMVPDCISLGGVQKTWTGAFKKSVISDWLRNAPVGYEEASRTFSRTLSGAVVFEHVLGLGDRHCDNLLLNPQLGIFHIDFGCCFGRDYGVATDAPVTLTSQMMDVIPASERDSFIEQTCDAFIAVRRHHVFLTALAMSALGARLPNLGKVSDVQILFDRLYVRVVEIEARKRFKENVLLKALSMKKQQINDGLHLYYMQHFYKAPKNSDK